MSSFPRLPALALALTVGASGALTQAPAQAAPAPDKAPQAAPQAVPRSTVAQVAGRPWPGHPGREIVRHRVRSGDTATELAVRYHAWTTELLSLNGLSATDTIRIGEVLRIPVVTARAGKDGKDKPKARTHRAHKATPRTSKQGSWDRRMRARGWRHFRHDRKTVRRIIEVQARRNGVPPRLALAIAWQESGWHQPVVSSAGAIGVMQVLPSTGDWMEQYAGRPLNLRGTHDNVHAGTLLLRVLRQHTSNDRRAIGAYYQGLGAVREYGLFPETQRYVANVKAIQHRLR